MSGNFGTAYGITPTIWKLGREALALIECDKIDEQEREREQAMNCDYCKDESNKEMCDHCAEAEEAGVLDDYLSGKVKCPACERESEL